MVRRPLKAAKANHVASDISIIAFLIAALHEWGAAHAPVPGWAQSRVRTHRDHREKTRRITILVGWPGRTSAKADARSKPMSTSMASPHPCRPVAIIPGTI